jgi:hypothetical protein
MTQSKKIGEYTYCTRILEASSKSDEYGKERERLRSNPDAWYAMWMNSRRQSEYAAFSNKQKQQIHETAIEINGDPVCTCGLICEIEVTEKPIAQNVLLLSPGHLNNETLSVISCFFINARSETDGSWITQIFCQFCERTETAPLTGARKKDGELLVRFSQEHSVCKGEK